MKISIVVPFGLRPKSTASRRALPLARALSARTDRVSLLVPPWDWPPDSGREWVDGGVRVRCLCLGPLLPVVFSGALLGRLVRSTLEAQPDIVHCFKPKAYAGLVAFVLWHARAAGLWSGKLVVDCDDWEGAGGWNELGGYSWPQRCLFDWQERWGLTHADGLTVASHTLRRLALALGVPQSRVHFLPNGMPPWLAPGSLDDGARRREAVDDGPVVLCYTRFVDCSQARLAAIISQVAARAPWARFLVVGAGLRGEESDFRAQLSRAVRATFTGWVAQNELPGHFATADVAIFPFDDKLINRARCPARLVDLLAAGVPVVAERVGEVPTYIENGISGILLRPDSPPSAWGDEVALLLRDGARRRRLGSVAQQRVQQEFNWDRLAEGLLPFYSQ